MTCSVTSTHITIILESLPKPEDDTLGDSKLLGYFPAGFSLQSDSLRTLIWRATGTRYHQENTIERHRYGGAGWLAFEEELFLVSEPTCMFRV
ncbi:HTH_Tnp_Tc3_2 domain-containing protein [Trichonephila clavipes]|nr:HTH_Tnp_Tc3_2 domain-containing protein [Trichonephila clavipes]